MRERDNGRTIVHAELKYMVIFLENPIEVEHVGPSYKEVISSDNQFKHIDLIEHLHLCQRSALKGHEGISQTWAWRCYHLSIDG